MLLLLPRYSGRAETSTSAKLFLVFMISDTDSFNGALMLSTCNLSGVRSDLMHVICRLSFGLFFLSRVVFFPSFRPLHPLSCCSLRLESMLRAVVIGWLDGMDSIM